MVEKVKKSLRSSKKITTSSTAEYFSKNLQQVGFSSATKAVLTSIKEAVDNSLDACEEAGILPDVNLRIEKVGVGSTKNTDKIRIIVDDNGPGIDVKDLPKVFGEYLASSKFGRGRCSRGQQGIGISAVTTWALQTTATGVKVISKRAGQRLAVSAEISIDLRNNKGVLKNKTTIPWDRPSGLSVEFVIDGRIQLNGEGGILSYIRGTALLNPHLTLKYKIQDDPEQVLERVSSVCVKVPEATEPHPHTMKLGEFISHAKLYGKVSLGQWLKSGFSRVSDSIIKELCEHVGIDSKTPLTSISDQEFHKIFSFIQKAALKAPSTQSVLSVGEEALAKSIVRLGSIDFFAVLTRKPVICDFKPVQVEVAIARLKEKGKASDQEDPVTVLRFANRVPLQFDKSGCAIVKAISTVNWRTYGLKQGRGSLPTGPYIIAVSVVSPFIKFKNASKETIDASEELVEEIRRALIQAGQKLSKHINKESKEKELENRLQHLERFSPILVDTLVRILGASEERKIKAEQGLERILGRDTKKAQESLTQADKALSKYLIKNQMLFDESEGLEDEDGDDDGNTGREEQIDSGEVVGEDLEIKLEEDLVETKQEVKKTEKAKKNSSGKKSVKKKK